jgi:Ca-activated chloride channel family protein
MISRFTGTGMLCAAALAMAWLLWASPACALRFSDRLHSNVEKGNEEYAEDETEGALGSYLRAQREDSTHAVPYFNAGDALYRMGKYDEGAMQFFRATKSQAESVAAMGYYNLGNTFYQKGDMQSAAEAYRRSLLMNPDDEDAKHNLEVVMRLIEEQPQQDQQDQQQQQDQQDQQQQQQQQQQEQDEQQEQDQNQEQQDQQDQQQQQQDEQQQQEKEEDQQSAQPQKKEISEDELERILAAIDESDKETQEEIARQASRTRRVSGKDW